ncbi:MAG TPA: hypothetical protein PKJ15_08110 [Methanomassiliicoccales archaeon]|nr:MAG: hypothetical protein A4E30_00966 [Methanomassiliicoccales archaeon PtaB.Bin215]HNU36548.1 hypothetical protein [Methanomassiliicoccales archaeon]
MSKEKVRKIAWHCAAGHDFEVEVEWQQERCPVCGGTDLHRIEKYGPIARFLGLDIKRERSKFWR